MLNHFRLFLPPRQSTLARLYLTVAFLHFGLSLVGIFVPIYIYQITGSFYWLAAFVGIISLSVLLFTFPLVNLIRRIGIYRAIFVSTLVRIAYLLLLLVAPRFFPLILLAALIDGLMIPLFWFPYHLIYVREGEDGRWGHQIGLMNLINILTGLPAPLLGGFIVANFGFGPLYLLGLSLVFLSSLPLLGMRDSIKVEAPSAKKVLEGLVKDDYRPLLFGFGGLRFAGVVGVFLWPLFVFKVAQSFTTLGAITSAGILVSLLANFFGAEFIDQVGSRRAFPFGAVAISSLWAVVGFATTVPAIFGVALLRSALGVFYSIPAGAITYSLAQHGRPFEFVLPFIGRKISLGPFCHPKPLEFLMRREFALHGAGVIVVILLAILWYIFPQNWPILFAPAVLGALASISLTKVEN